MNNAAEELLWDLTSGDYVVDQTPLLDEDRFTIKPKNTVSIEETQTKENTQVAASTYEQLDIVDLREDQKTMNQKAREHIDKIARLKKDGGIEFDGAIEMWTHYLMKGIDKLSIKEERSKGDHDSMKNYLAQLDRVLGLSASTEKITVVTDIRRSGDDLFNT